MRVRGSRPGGSSRLGVWKRLTLTALGLAGDILVGGALLFSGSAVTAQPMTTLIYSHAHNDHIGGSAAFADIEGLEILASTGVAEFLAEKEDPDRLRPTQSLDNELVLEPGGTRIELRTANYHSDEGDVVVYMPQARFLMAIDTLAPGYAPFMGFDITSDFHEYLNVFAEDHVRTALIYVRLDD